MQTVAGISPNYNIHNLLGHLYGIKGMQAGVSEEETSLLNELAIENMVKGLSHAPASPYPWARYAQLEILKGDIAKAAKGIKVSYMNGFYDDRLFLPRLKIALSAFNEIDHEGRDIVKRQIILGMEDNPKEIVRVAWGNRNILPIIRNLLAEQPDHLKKFNEMYNPFSSSGDS
ncbi:MAG: hypothetical protein OEY64_06600 [Nitrospinota bacterium]|nr:hypothetical protein [Nitrospinota bacterium]